MRKLLMLLLSFAITLTFAGCIHKTAKLDYTAVLQAAESQRESAAPESAQTEVPEQEATAGHADSVTHYDFSYADITDVFANEDSYIGKVYAGPFQITGDLQKRKTNGLPLELPTAKTRMRTITRS